MFKMSLCSSANLRITVLLGFLLFTCALAEGHEYHSDGFIIRHPTIMVPSGQADCSCAHMKITNDGKKTEYFLGAVISAASRTHLLHILPNSKGIYIPGKVPIAPGETLDLNRQEWCLFMSGLNTTLEADFGSVSGVLLFEGRQSLSIEFMIDAAVEP
jgi:copper(I)-binding protein